MFIERNPFYLRIKPSIFSSPPSSSFSSSSNSFLAENSYDVGEDTATTRTNAATIARTDIVVPQTNVEEGDFLTDVANNVVAFIDPPFIASFDFFGHFPQPELTSCTSE